MGKKLKENILLIWITGIAALFVFAGGGLGIIISTLRPDRPKNKPVKKKKGASTGKGKKG